MKKISIIILLVLCLTLLLLTGCIVNTVIPETTSGNLGNQENTEEPVIVDTEKPVIVDTEKPVIVYTEEPGTANPQKWSGLTGFTMWYDDVYSSADTWLANGFTEIRSLMDYTDTTNLNGLKAAVIAGNAKGLKFIFGVSSNPTVITATNWPTFRQAILDAADWAQDNGVYEFQIGNEEEWHVDGTTMTVAQIITNLKSVATDVQEIFTNGNVSYTCEPLYIDAWIAAGKGDIDLLASNVYSEWGVHNTVPWEDEIDALVGAFGTGGTYITEFNLNVWGLDYYSTDEAVQATALTEMIEYIKASGIERALFYSWHDYPGGLFGVIKADETYRLLWNQALLNSGSVKSITVPAKTATISLPNTIALIPK
jgi:hypothetical protein